MMYRKEDDNRYRVRFMRSTEKLMDALTVKEFISYLEENAELEDDANYEYIDGEVTKCKAYDLKEADSNLHKEFLVTEDGRLFYWLSLKRKIELVDRKKQEEYEIKGQNPLKVKKLYTAMNLPFRMVIETVDGEYKSFHIIPVRKLTEKDLAPMKYWKPQGNQSEEAEPYFYDMYNLEKTEEG